MMVLWRCGSKRRERVWVMKERVKKVRVNPLAPDPLVCPSLLLYNEENHS